MKWHDCKINPPKKDGHYLLWVRYNDKDTGKFCSVEFIAKYNAYNKEWIDDVENEHICDEYVYKWAKIDLKGFEYW